MNVIGKLYGCQYLGCNNMAYFYKKLHGGNCAKCGRNFCINSYTCMQDVQVSQQQFQLKDLRMITEAFFIIHKQTGNSN